MSKKNPFARVSARFQQDGLQGILTALKWKLFRWKSMVVTIRGVDKPLADVPRHRSQSVVFRLATLKDLDAMAFNFPEKRKWYKKRLETPGYWCDLGLEGNVVVAHNWFCTVPHLDPEMDCWVRPKEGQAYWFEGWCLSEWRNRGVSNRGVKHCFEDLFPDLGIQEVMTLLEEENRATRRLHARYDFQDIGRQIHLRLGPFHINSPILPLRKKKELQKKA